MHRGSENDKHRGRKVPIHKDPHAAGSPEADGPEIAEAPGAKPESVDELEALRAELEEARQKLREQNDKYLRLAADTENYKKRMSRESAEREKYYNEAIIKEILPVLDNLERALEHAGEQNGGFADGVRMVRKQFMDSLGKFGVRSVESVGLPFDPEKQQAMTQVETDEYEEGTVVEEFQKGYFLNDRIIRPAMVVVAKKPSGSTGGGG